MADVITSSAEVLGLGRLSGRDHSSDFVFFFGVHSKLSVVFFGVLHLEDVEDVDGSSFFL